MRWPVGLTQRDIGFTVSGSSDYLQGFPFAFVGALDAVGAWPPIRESHLEMDGAFALAEAVEVLQHGAGREPLDTALVYAFARPSRGELDRTLALQLDPYSVAPLWPMPAGWPDCRRRRCATAAGSPTCRTSRRPWSRTARPRWCSRSGIAPGSSPTPGLDPRHRPSDRGAGARRPRPDRSASTSRGRRARRHDRHRRRLAARALPAPGALARDALGLVDQPVDAAAGPMMVGGLERLAAAATAVAAGRARGRLRTPRSGPCLQQNLVAVLERDAA